MMVNHHPIEDLMPHAAPMLLLDRLLSFDIDAAHAQVTMQADHPFARPLGIPAHLGIEVMAQTCGAHVGALARNDDQGVRIGFLLGTRAFSADRDWFALGDVLDIFVCRTFCEDGMGVYDCRIDIAGQSVATAQLSLYQPPDIATAIAKLKGPQ